MISNREGREWLLKQLHDKGIKYIVYLGGIFGYVGVEKKPEQQEDGSTLLRDTYHRLDAVSEMLPDFNEPNFLDIGKYLGITDWSKVATDTPIYVKLNRNDTWDKYHFAKYENGKVYCWSLGTTSWSTKSAEAYIPVSDARLVEGGKP